MQTTKLITVSFLALLTLGATMGACSSSSGDSAACATLCGATEDCGGTTCVSACLATQVTCAAKGVPSTFDGFTSCAPIIACGLTGYTVSNCELPQLEIIAECGTPVLSGSIGGSGGGHDGGTIVFNDGGTDVHVTAPDTGTCGVCASSCVNACGESCTGGSCPTGGDDSGEDSGCGICQSSCENSCGESCTGGDCESSDDSGGCGICQSSCENSCGESCTGGDCESSDDTGSCGICQSDCENSCGESCTGGDCESSDDSGSCGICQSSCENSCGESCTGGDCESCVSTGCTNCETSCDDGDACEDNCGNECC